MRHRRLSDRRAHDARVPIRIARLSLNEIAGDARDKFGVTARFVHERLVAKVTVRHFWEKSSVSLQFWHRVNSRTRVFASAMYCRVSSENIPLDIRIDLKASAYAFAISFSIKAISLGFLI